jgi:thiosulfate/3-mercaptopyruvate sulfurtransferase
MSSWKSAGWTLVSALALTCAARAVSAAEVRNQMLVSTAWLAENLQRPELVVLHVAHERSGYDAAHIPGARFVAVREVAVERGTTNELPPVEDLVALVRRLGIDQDSRIVIYEEGAGMRAARLYWALDYLGLGDNAALLDGQWKKWQAEQRPMTAAAPEVRPSRYVPRLRPEVVVGFGTMRDLSAAKAKMAELPLAMVDARPSSQYTGEEAYEGERAGHIPGAASLFWMRTLVSEQNPVLRPAEEIRELYRQAGAEAGHLVITYCHSGFQASHAYFTARYLGYDVRMYDGSIIEWSAQADAPLVQAAETKRWVK